MSEVNKPIEPIEDDKDQSLSLTGVSLPSWLRLGGKWDQFRTFLQEVRGEMRKISWPTRRQVITETGVVILVTTILTLLVMFLDWVFTFLANRWLV